jgi:cobalt-zinc-cadmium efflux system outer membrane protein
MSAHRFQLLAGEPARRARRAVAWSLLAVLTACTTAPKDAGYSEVQNRVSDRTSLTVRWNDPKVSTAVNELLTREMTVNDAAQIALLNNRHLQATFETLGIAQSDLVQAGLLKNPVIDINIRFPDRPPSATYLDFAMAEDFLDLVMLPARTKIAAAQFEEAKSTVTNEVLTLVARTSTDFYAYQCAAKILELQRELAQAAEASLQAAKTLHDAGNSTDLSFAESRAQAARARIELADAEMDLADAREKVNDDLGLPDPQTHWKAAPLLDLPDQEITGKNLESLAFHQRQDLTAARQDVLVQSQALGLTSDFRFFSQTDVGVEFERETDGQWRIGPGLSIPVPLFDQGQAKMSRAEAQLRQSEDRYLAMIIDVQSQVRAARNKFLAARNKAILFRDEVLPIQKDVLHQTNLQYNGMYTGIFEFLEAKRDQIQATREYTQSLRDYWAARVELERAIGSRLPTPTATTQREDNQ